MELHSWLLFVSLALIATITPGPAVLLVTSNSLSFGWRRSLFIALGNITGLLILSGLSVAGLSVIILNSALIFSIVKFSGALYLIYLGIKIWRHGFRRGADFQKHSEASPSRISLYGSGLTVAISNPKAIAFTTALFPQFISHEAPLPFQFGLLVVTFMTLSFTCLAGYAYMAAHARLSFVKAAPNWLNRFFGASFILAGIALASSPRGAD